MPKKNVKHIEFVCTANNGRSPLAETIAKTYLEANYPELDDPTNPELIISSSGSNTEEVWSDVKKFNVETALFFIDHAIKYQEAKGDLFLENMQKQYGIIKELSILLNSPDLKKTEFIRTALKYDINDLNQHKLSKSEIYLALKLTRRLEANLEAKHRDMYLQEIYFKTAEGKFRKQTTYNPKISLILSMSQNNVEQVDKIYGSSTPDLGIFTLQEYVGLEMSMPSAYISPDEAETNKLYDYINLITCMAMQKFVEENF